MEKSNGEWITVLNLKVGKYQYKFKVGNEWKYDMSAPTENDATGCVNNVITVSGTKCIISDFF